MSAGASLDDVNLHLRFASNALTLDPHGLICRPSISVDHMGVSRSLKSQSQFGYWIGHCYYWGLKEPAPGKLIFNSYRLRVQGPQNRSYKVRKGK